MSFAEVYSEEVIETRRIRAQRARFWARIVSLLLMITVAATLHSEPRLRAALFSAAIDGLLSFNRTEAATFETSTPPLGNAPHPAADHEGLMELLKQLQPGNLGSAAPSQSAPEASAHPRDTVKVNRFGDSPFGPEPSFKRVGPKVESSPALQDPPPLPKETELDFGKLLQRFTGGS